ITKPSVIREQVPISLYLSAMSVTAANYTIALISGILLQKRLNWLSSWFSMGVVAVFIHLTIRMLLHFPDALDYELKFRTTSFSVAVINVILDAATAITVNLILLGIISLMLIFSVRFFVYLMRATYITYCNYKVRFP
ncbi:MAG TPA: hypothetical protein VK400_05790, partial [Pyrinomonadaceae bacterium]|nr:hypothetical protein [Pyrinomonadaceae bacterium]